LNETLLRQVALSTHIQFLEDVLAAVEDGRLLLANVFRIWTFEKHQTLGERRGFHHGQRKPRTGFS
jgi:hypothetical protein